MEVNRSWTEHAGVNGLGGNAGAGAQTNYRNGVALFTSFNT